jgi:hypothetical protein
MYRSKPAWWQLYLLAICAMGVIVLAHFWNVSEAVHGTANIAIVLTAYGAFNVWLSFNGEALERQQEAKEDAARGKALAVTDQQAHYRHLTHLHGMLRTSSKHNQRE